MKDSKSKAMNWSENIYHKFEGIIPDVNDVKIQDTFKYVENHVTTVGGSFKKFCSGVVQDFFPLSTDPAKHEAEAVTPKTNPSILADSAICESEAVNCAVAVGLAKQEAKAVTLEGTRAIGTCDDLRGSISEASLESVVKQSPAATDPMDCGEKRPGLVFAADTDVDELTVANSIECNEIPDAVFSGLANEGSGMSGNNLNGTKECEDEPFKLTSPGVTEPLKDLFGTKHENRSFFSTVIASETSAENQEIESNILSHSTRSDFGEPSTISETAIAVISDPDGLTGKGHFSSGRSAWTDSTGPRRRRSLSDIFSLSPNVIDLAGLVSDGHNELSATPTSATLTKDLLEEKQLVSSGSNISLKSKDDSSADIAADLGMETINLHDEVKLGESCVFVDDTVLYAISRRARKLGSYRKKIQDLFTSRKRLAKEYEQLAIWYGDTDIDSSPNPQSSQTRQACDSEWELL